MPVLSSTDLYLLCERRARRWLAADQLTLHGFSYSTLARRVSQVVTRNLASGRAGRIMGASVTLTDHLIPYVDRIISIVLTEHQRLDRLVARDSYTWTELFSQLTRRAQVMLAWLGHQTAIATEAADFAQEACEAIFDDVFPFDVAFDAWATRILKNRILQRRTRSRDLLDQDVEVMSLDRPHPTHGQEDLSLHEVLADSSLAEFEQAEVQAWLLQAIGRLPSSPQQQVIINLYFYDMSEEETALRLGKSIQAIYNLKHRALRLLNQALTKERLDEINTSC